MQTIDFDSGFAVLDGLASVRQRVLQVLRMNLGEWFLNPRAGTPYLTQVFGRRYTPLAESVIRRRIEEVDGVDEVISVTASADRALRSLNLTVVLRSDGETTSVGISI